jgi:hypothetical protein
MSELQLTDIATQERLFKYAQFVSQSDLIPTHFKGKPANVLIALGMAKRLDIDFFEMANAIYVVHGRPAFSGAFIISRINNSGKFKTPLLFDSEGSGKTLKVTCSATNNYDQRCKVTIGMDMAIAEGWDKNPKYRSMPEQMLVYRSASFFCRRYCPEVLMGAKTLDEVEDIELSQNKLLKPVEWKEEAVLIEKQEPKQEPQKPQKDLTALTEEAERYMKEAIDLGIPTETIDKINPDLDNEDQLINAIHLLKTMIRDRLRLLKEGM